MSYLPRCPYLDHEDCFAKRGCLCEALADTDFKGKDCKFYKSWEQNEKDKRKSKEKNGKKRILWP